MSSETGATSPEPEGLQFDHAEFDNVEGPADIACAGCGKPIDHYYEMNWTIVCESCRYTIEEQIWGGSKLARFAKAVVFGSAAALVGAIAYGAFRIMSPVDISLVAILVGFIVGKSVRKGSNNLGGVAYQLLAVALTYTSLALAYLIWIIYVVIHPMDPAQLAAKPKAVPNANAPEQAKGAPAPAAQPGEAPAAAGQKGIRILPLILLAFSTPVIMMQASPIMIAFVGFALWEAWKFNAPLQLRITGPYRIGEGGPFEGGVPGHA